MPSEMGWGGQIGLEAGRADFTPQSYFRAKLSPDASRKSSELHQPGVILGPSDLPPSCLQTLKLSGLVGFIIQRWFLVLLCSQGKPEIKKVNNIVKKRGAIK